MTQMKEIDLREAKIGLAPSSGYRNIFNINWLYIYIPVLSFVKAIM